MSVLKRIGIKALACVVTSLIVAFVAAFFLFNPSRADYYPIIVMYIVGFGSLIGIPFSLVSDLIIYKFERKFIQYVTGFILHIVFGGIALYWLIKDETVGRQLFTYSVLLTAFGLWLFDSILKNLRVFR